MTNDSRLTHHFDWPGGAWMVTKMEIQRIKQLGLPCDQAATELLEQLTSAGYVIELAPDQIDSSGAQS